MARAHLYAPPEGRVGLVYLRPPANLGDVFPELTGRNEEEAILPAIQRIRADLPSR